MSRPRSIALLLAAGLFGASAATGLHYASASTASTAAPLPSAGAQAEEEKPIDFEPIPLDDTDTKTPKAADWVSATRVRFTRKGPRAEGCRAWRTRNWVKIHCDFQSTAIGLVGGAFKGVAMWMPEPKEGAAAPQSCEAMFPIRPGDRRVFEFFSFGETYGGSMISPGLVLQEYWLPGEPAPVIILR
jgi:hypothetical protein